jgi:hypothetical protein
MRLTWIALVFVALVLGSVSPSYAQAADKPTKTFEGDAAVALIYVKADKTADFEELMAKFKEALGKADAAEVKQQAAGIKIFKAPAGPAPAGSALYLMICDPVVKNVEYWFLSILYKAFPADAQALYQKWQDSKAATGPVFFDLTAIK